MENRRRFIRFFSQLKARYTLMGGGGWKECAVINASLKGMSIKFYTHEKINLGSIIYLVVAIPTELVPINVSGALKWIEQEVNYFIGGVEYAELLDDKKFAKLGLF